MTLNLNKPAIEHNGQERADIYKKLTMEILKNFSKVKKEKTYNHLQFNRAKSLAWKKMAEAGF